MMKPPYEITSLILELITSISEKIGTINSNFLNKPSPQLRKQNKIKTIHSSLKIEGNSLTEEQITALIENKRVIGSNKDIKELQIALDPIEQTIYNHLNQKGKSLLDEIAVECDIPTHKLSSVLLTTELKEAIRPLPGKLFEVK